MMKKAEEKNVKAEIKVDQVKTAGAAPKKPWTKHVRHYYIYDPGKGFLMKDKTFAVKGDRYVFDNVITAKAIQQFLDGTTILTEV